VDNERLRLVLMMMLVQVDVVDDAGTGRCGC